MFPIEAIVLKKSRIENNKVVISCFSREYGKIDVFHKESSSMINLDTLCFFTGQVKTKTHNTLTNVYRTIIFTPMSNYDLYELSGYLVSVLYKLLPYGVAYPRLFQFLKNITINHETCNHDLLLFLVQTCHDFGIMSNKIEDYSLLLENTEGQKKVKYEIEMWVNAYIRST